MDEIVAKPAARLYEDDFYAWTQAQADLLRTGQLDQADITNIIEEIDSLGRQQVAELRSRLKVLVMHLLKERFQPEKASRSWRTTIVTQRGEIAQHIEDNPSLKSKQADVFRTAYKRALRPVASQTNLPIASFPAEPPFSLQQALDPEFWPGRSYDDRG